MFPSNSCYYTHTPSPPLLFLLLFFPFFPLFPLRFSFLPGAVLPADERSCWLCVLEEGVRFVVIFFLKFSVHCSAPPP